MAREGDAVEFGGRRADERRERDPVRTGPGRRGRHDRQRVADRDVGQARDDVVCLDGDDRREPSVAAQPDDIVGEARPGCRVYDKRGVLPDILRRYRSRYPGVALSLSEHSPGDLLRGLHEHRIEAAFLFASYRGEALRARCVSTQRLVAALPKRHPLAARDTVDVRALAEGPMILPTQHETPGLFSRIRLLFDELDLQPNGVQRDIWMMQTIIGLVAAEMGATIVPSSVAELRRDGVVYRRLEQDVAPVEMTVAWRRDTGSAALAAFVQTATSRVYDIPGP
jgi:DNA-binding transcriptional LysR family regulator